MTGLEWPSCRRITGLDPGEMPEACDRPALVRLLSLVGAVSRPRLSEPIKPGRCPRLSGETIDPSPWSGGSCWLEVVLAPAMPHELHATAPGQLIGTPTNTATSWDHLGRRQHSPCRTQLAVHGNSRPCLAQCHNSSTRSRWQDPYGPVPEGERMSISVRQW